MSEDIKLEKVKELLSASPKQTAANTRIVDTLKFWSSLSEYREWRRPFIISGILVSRQGKGGATALVGGEAQVKTSQTKTKTYTITDKASRLLELIPSDGSSVGNTYLQSKSDLSREEYWNVRQELLNASLLQVGKGRGGSVSRSDKGVETSTAVDERKLMKNEKELYEPLKKWLELNWGDEAESAGDYHYTKITATGKGKKRDSGKWSRPDITFVRVNKFDFLPGSYVEVTSFEVKKRSDAKDLSSVFEAAAHERIAQNCYLVAEVLSEEDKIDPSIEKECGRLGVGIIKAFRNSKSFNFIEYLEPKLQNPAPEDLNSYLKRLFSDINVEEKKFRIQIGKG